VRIEGQGGPAEHVGVHQDQDVYHAVVVLALEVKHQGIDATCAQFQLDQVPGICQSRLVLNVVCCFKKMWKRHDATNTDVPSLRSIVS